MYILRLWEVGPALSSIDVSSAALPLGGLALLVCVGPWGAALGTGYCYGLLEGMATECLYDASILGNYDRGVPYYEATK